MKNKLPNTPSKLVAIARKDLRAVSKLKRYRINMGVWHCAVGGVATPETPCEVCQAGAVMARTLKADINEDLSNYSFDDATQDKLSALNYLRRGNIYAFL